MERKTGFASAGAFRASKKKSLQKAVKPATNVFFQGWGGPSMGATLSRILRYPVKGLSAEDLESISLQPEQGIAFDRRFALALASTQIDEDHPKWLPKTSFLTLLRDERLAALDTSFDDASGTLTILRNERKIASGCLFDTIGRAMIEDFFSAYMKGKPPGKPRLVEAHQGHMFSDHEKRVLSVVNLASVKDLERVVGDVVDPLRFRANLYLEGLAPWEEFSWVDQTISIGSVRFKITSRIDRCGATNVDPKTGARDMNIPKALRQGFSHIDMGVYAAIENEGKLSCGDGIEIL
jgi:uncharacterized protein